MITRLILTALLLLSTVAMAGNVKLDVTATTNQTSNVKMLFKDAEGSYPDTSTVSWETGATVHSGDFDTGIAAAVANADSGGINISWTAATGHDGYRLDFDPNGDGWATASFIHVDSTTFGHDIGSTAEPRRGEINYRLRSFTADPDTTWSAVVLITDLFYNQAKRVYSKFHASDGATIVESDEGSALLISYDPPSATTDTLGSGDVGTFNAAAGANAFGGRITMVEDGTIESATFYLEPGSDAIEVRAGLWEGAGGSIPLLDSGSLTIASGASAGWFEVTFDSPYAATSGDVFTVMLRSNIAVNMKYGSEATNPNAIGFGDGVTYAAFPEATMSAGGSYFDRRYSFYVTYSH